MRRRDKGEQREQLLREATADRIRSDDVRSNLRAMAASGNVDDEKLKEAMINILLVKLADAKDTAEVVKITTELRKLRNLDPDRTTGDGDPNWYLRQLEELRAREGKEHIR